MSSADMSPSDRNRQIRYLLNPKELDQVTARQIKSFFVCSVSRMADTLGLFYSLCKERVVEEWMNHVTIEKFLN